MSAPRAPRALHFRQVLFGHALRNALVPFLTLAGWEFINALAGYTVVVETVFAWPGLGLTAMKAIEHSDLFLLQAIVFTVAILIVLVNIALDVALQTHRSSHQAGLNDDSRNERRVARRSQRPLQRSSSRARDELWHDKAGLIGFTVIVLLVLMAIFAPLIAPYDPAAQDRSRRG